MDNAVRHCLNSYLKEISDRYDTEKTRMEYLSEYTSKRLKVTTDKAGREYYYIFDPEKAAFKYAGTCNDEEVRKIKQAHFLKLMTIELLREKQLIENILRKTRGTGYTDIDEKLRKAYKGAQISNIGCGSAKAAEWKQSMEQYKSTFPPFRPEELIVTTRDGTRVRSRGEALIYNYLLDIGITFVYELPLRINYDGKRSLLLPDFTILSEVDFETVIYIEHQGMMNTPKYRNKFNDAVFKYWLNNYIPERDVFFTFDLPNGGFDDAPVKDIVRRHIRPT